MRPYLTTLGSLAAVGAIAAGFSSCASDSHKPTPSAFAGVSDLDMAAAKAVLADVPLGRVVTRDARGAARVVVAAAPASAARVGLSPEAATRLHLERHAGVLGLSPAITRNAVFKGWHSLPSGAGIAKYEQRINNVEVFRARAAVLVDASNHLVSITNSMPKLGARISNKTGAFKMSAEQALATAYTAHSGIMLTSDNVRDEGQVSDSDARNYAVQAPNGAMRVMTATAKRVLFPAGELLEPAYYVEILGRSATTRDDDARSFVIAADDGRVLYQASLTDHEVFNYKVWADTTGLKVPMDGPIKDIMPHPTGSAPTSATDRVVQEFVPQVMIAADGFNKMKDPWLKPGDTTTFGNNVLAYDDRNSGTNDAGRAVGDGYQPDAGDLLAETTGPNTFDRTFDPTKAPNFSSDQIKASITQIFYVNNWLHDFWYDSGFDELRANGQASNYSRGGRENDPIRAEAQDSAGSGQSNNANMSTLADGTSPRMQMYVWTGLANRLLEVPGVTFSDPLGASGFGPQTFDMTGSPILSDDGSTVATTGTLPGTLADACQRPTNVTGKIAVIERGQCNFTDKVANAQAGGATGIILVNNAMGNVAPSPGGSFPAATIPLIGISFEDGVKLKAALASSPMAHLKRGEETMRDGTIDNTIVAHEWGHYFHHRLVSCGSTSCGGMSEGWGDFVALMMSIREGDTFDAGKVYPLAQYAAQGISKDGSYFGIRRAPYSRDITKNPFTFGHIRAMATLPVGVPLAPAGAEMNEVHNVGEIWTETLFEAYANLIDLGKTSTPPFSFDEARRRMADYIVTGMDLAPAEPTFVEQRDSILQAVIASKRTEDFMAIAKAFAKRGLGVAAVAPPTSSTTLNEAVENFDFKGNLGFLEASTDDSMTSCDKDGILDANESGKLTVKIRNSGWNKLTKSSVKVTSTDDSVTFANGGMTDMVSLDPFGTATLTIGMTAKAGLTKKAILPLVITLADTEAANPTTEIKYNAVINADDTKASSATDDVESTLAPVWTMSHGDSGGDAGTGTTSDAGTSATPEIWAREGTADNHLWHGSGAASASDESLVSPELSVHATEPFTMSISHAYGFETGVITGTTMGNFDGAVIEVTEDNGTTWKDISDYVDPMYPGTITSTEPFGTPDTNVLKGRKGFVGSSTGYPMLATLKVDLGTKLAGKKVKVRFRIGSDEGTSSQGWDIDNIAFTGITNTPFAKVGDHAGICGDAGPKTDAGSPDASTTGTGGTGGATGGGGGTADDGCSCSVPGGRSTSNGMIAGVLGALAMIVRRRRRQS